MEEYLGNEEAEQFLVGTLIVRVVDSRTDRPVPGVKVAVADSLEVACRKG